MATATKPVVYLDDVYSAIRDGYRKAITVGKGWHAVTVGVDGLPAIRSEMSECVGESEYFGNVIPHPVTVWEMKGDSSVDSADVEINVDEFDPRDALKGYGDEAEMVRLLEEAGFAVEV